MKSLQRTLIALLALMALFAFPVHAQNVQSKSYGKMLKHLLSHSVKEISVSDIGSDTDYIFVDTREKKEFNVSHIKNAVWCGYDDFDINRMKSIPKDKNIITYCSVGYRSEKIAEKLIKAGYTDVSNLYGGIFEWKNEGRKLYDSSGNVTNKIHAYNFIWGKWVSAEEKVYD